MQSHLFDELRESEMAELAAIDRAARIRLRKLMAHPDCRDPDHPECNQCNEKKKNDELETHNASRR